MADSITVTPSELKFRFELKKNIPVTLTLLNGSKDRVAFKIKTTSPKKYCVRPSNGFIEPSSSRDVQVILQAQREAPASLADVKDKFLVQAVRLPGSPDDQAAVREITPGLFDPASGLTISQTKLRVAFVEPPKPPSPVPEGEEEAASPSSRGGTPGGARRGAGSSLGGLAEPSGAAAEKAEIRRRLAAAAGPSDGSLQRSLANPRRAASGTFSLVHVLLAALLAFVLGWVAAGGGATFLKTLRGE